MAEKKPNTQESARIVVSLISDLRRETAEKIANHLNDFHEKTGLIVRDINVRTEDVTGIGELEPAFRHRVYLSVEFGYTDNPYD